MQENSKIAGLKKQLIWVAARASLLSKAQVAEVHRELCFYHPHILFKPLWIETRGDLDLKTSLRLMEKSDFFTREVDEAVLSCSCAIAIHSAKDLPDPLHPKLKIIALTRGVDSSDVLVLRQEESFESLPSGSLIGVSCLRREKAILSLRSDLRCADIRGTVEKRLQLLDEGVFDGVVMAEAALIRLNWTCRNRFKLLTETAPFQGKLAIVSSFNNSEMAALFSCIDSRKFL
jgi:hydroxymethylbilane synthase